MAKRVFEIDGRNFDTLEGFFEAAGKAMGTAPWGRNFDSFNDVLAGGFGTPDEGFVLRWVNSGSSRVALGYQATIAWREQTLERCYPDQVASVEADLATARRGEGHTIFDILLVIIRSHGPGGEQEVSGVELELA